MGGGEAPRDREDNMRRTILFLAAGLVGSGCYPCDRNDVALFWHFPNADGTAELACADAGVSRVQIAVDGVVEATVDCTLADQRGDPVQGVTLTNFARRPYSFQLDGLDARGVAVYSSAFSFEPTVCGLNVVDETLTPLVGDLLIPYAFQGGGGCSAPGPDSAFPTTFVWFRLLDQDGRLFSAVDATQDPTALPCGAGDFTILVPGALFGRYTLAGIEEVEILRSGAAVVRRYNCARASFQHLGSGDAWSPVPQLGPVLPGAATCF
jgi:hypothetical protein